MLERGLLSKYKVRTWAVGEDGPDKKRRYVGLEAK